MIWLIQENFNPKDSSFKVSGGYMSKLASIEDTRRVSVYIKNAVSAQRIPLKVIANEVGVSIQAVSDAMHGKVKRMRVRNFESYANYFGRTNDFDRQMTNRPPKSFTGQTLVDTTFPASENLDEVDFSDTTLIRVRFDEVSARRAKFDRANLYECSFENANLQGSRWVKTKAPYANFRGANLRDAWLCGGQFPMCNFSGADVSGAVVNTPLNTADAWDGANLQDVNLWGFQGAHNNHTLLGALFKEMLPGRGGRYISSCTGSVSNGIFRYCSKL